MNIIQILSEIKLSDNFCVIFHTQIVIAIFVFDKTIPMYWTGVYILRPKSTNFAHPFSQFFKLPPSAHFCNILAHFFTRLEGNFTNWEVKYRRPLIVFSCLFIFFFTFSSIFYVNFPNFFL